MSGSPILFDQFYTNQEVADKCVASFLKVVGPYIKEDTTIFVEPSAGTGAFLRSLNAHSCRWVAGDIDPHGEGIQTKNFLKETFDLPRHSHCCVVGNPPFGKKSALAIQFLNKSLLMADFVGFILPVQFLKYHTQKRIIDGAHLIYSEIGESHAFIANKKPYDIRWVFQIWTTRNIGVPDKRLTGASPIKHPDFTMGLYNCTPATEHYFKDKWDFAVLRQGWGDFSIVPGKDIPSLSRKKQWLFFAAKDPIVIQRLRTIPFHELALRNTTSVKGFGKADVVEWYIRVYPIQKNQVTLF